MLLDDALEDFGRAVAIPHPFRIDHRDRTFAAHAQAIGLGTRDTVLGQVELFQPPLEIIPGLVRILARAALGLALVTAQEDVPPRTDDSDFVDARSQRLGVMGGA